MIGLLGLALGRVRWSGRAWVTVVAAGVAGAVLTVLGDLLVGGGGATLRAATHIRHAFWDADANVLVGAVTALTRG